MQGLLQDIRYSLRQFIKNPGFTLTALISLALGIGATTAVFSVIYAALMNPYPYPNADRIVRLTMESKSGTDDWANLNGPQIRQLRQLSVIESVLAMDFHAMTLTGPEVPENVNVVGLISTGFTDLGVPPVLGRGLLPSDAIDGEDPQPVVVIGYKFWQKHFLGNPDAVGKTLQLDRKDYLIVGVAAPRFTWYSADVYRPLKLSQDPARTNLVNVRLKPGVTHEQANAVLQPLLEQFARDMPKHFPEHFKVKVEDLNAWVRRGISGTLYLLFGAVALLLAIGCGNVSILLLARGTARQHELAVRTAIGAQRRRIVRQLLTESLLLATMGAGLGVVAAYGILAGMRVVLPRDAFAPEVVININLPVLLFCVGVALATGVLFGLGPSLRLSRTQVGHMMQSSARRVLGSVHGRRTYDALIAGQIALTLLLLAGAGSAMEGFLRLLHTRLGYDPHNVISVGVPLHENTFITWESRNAYFEQLRAKVAETPGVTMTAISTNATPPHSGDNLRFEILGRPAVEEQMGLVNSVSEGYFAALRIPLLEGRVWDEAENHRAALVAVINRTLAQRYFPDGNAVGHSLKVPGFEERPPLILSVPKLADSWLQIVGVVDDAKDDGLLEPVKPAIYLPYTLSLRQWTQILVRADVPPLMLLHTIRQQMAAVNPEQQTFSEVEDLDTWISDEQEWQQEHLAAWIFGVFGVLALALAAVGLYSVVSYSVVQRTNEFGIRMALGAGRGHVLRIVFASTVVSVGSGITAGLVLAIGLNSVVQKWAQGDARDPLILLAGTALLVTVSAVACALPARYASRVDPMKALRYE
ncbi:MAG TPA: ABC transporter permease [Candidatus Sulfotelmatobacter sp.]|jgi:predicted permease|nr:ABC transporter permease [Candidatus Sulfotelmatobacter sp.]